MLELSGMGEFGLGVASGGKTLCGADGLSAARAYAAEDFGLEREEK
jgi:hypothetical protein